MKWGWLAPLVLSGALAGCGGRAGSSHDRRHHETGFTAEDFPEDEENEENGEGPALPTRDPFAAAPPPATTPTSSRRECGTDGVVRRSVVVSDQAQLDALAGCEHITADLTLHLFANMDQAPLLDLRVVEASVSVYGAAAPTQGIEGLGSLEQVGTLLLSGLELRDLGALGQLRSIDGPPYEPFDPYNTDGRGLEIDNCSGLTSLNGLDALESVERIHLNGNPELVSLAGIDNVHAVEELSSVDCPLLDLQGLEQLSVRTLSLTTTALTSLAGLGNAPRLLRLILSTNPALASLQGGVFPARMEEVQVGDSDVLSNLQGLEGLRDVDILGIYAADAGRSSLTSLAGLEALEHVGYFSLSNLSSLTQLSGLEALLRVEQLQVSACGLRDLTGMPNLQQLGELSLLGTPALTGLQGLGNVNLTNLWLYDVPLTNLAGLEQVDLLDEGQLQITTSPHLASLQGLPPLTRLSQVALYETPVLEDVQALAGLTALEVLSLESTGLTHLDAFGNLRKLARLYVLNNSQLVRMDGLSAAAGLREVSVINNDALQTWPTALPERGGYIGVSDNQSLTALPGFSNLRSVVVLSIEDNPSLTELDLSNLEDTGTLFIRGNGMLDDEPFEPLGQRLPRNAQVKIVSNLSGPERLSPCPWLNDGVCDEERADCAVGSDARDCLSWR